MFCGVGGIVAIIELLTIVLACCYANQIAKLEREEEWEKGWKVYIRTGMDPLASKSVRCAQFDVYKNLKQKEMMQGRFAISNNVDQ